MFFQYLKRGLATGVVVGIAFGIFMAVVGNPFVVYADELAHGGGHGAEAEGGSGHHSDAESAHEEGSHSGEEKHHEEGSHSGEGEHAGESGGHGHGSAVSMAVTKAVSAAASGFWAVLFGAVAFGIAFFFLEPTLPGTAGAKSYVMAAIGFITVSGAPWLALPPAAPGMEQALGTQTRLAIYGGMMVAGLVASLLSLFAYDRVSDDHGRAVGVLAALVPLALLPVAALLAPANPMHGSLPPALVQTFQGFVITTQMALWFGLASVHAWFQRRADDDAPDVDTDFADSDVSTV